MVVTIKILTRDTVSIFKVKIGVNKHVYTFKIVNNILGDHFVCLYDKILPIISEANKHEDKIRHYSNFADLVKKLSHK